MKKYPMLATLLQFVLAITIGLLEKVCVLLYCLLPIGLFMLIMSFRSKNHKTTALSTFTNENSEFQHIFPNYLMVVVEPKYLKRLVNKKINEINEFNNKYKWVYLVLIMLLLFLILTIMIVK